MCEKVLVGACGRVRPRQTWDEVLKHDHQTLGIMEVMTSTETSGDMLCLGRHTKLSERVVMACVT